MKEGKQKRYGMVNIILCVSLLEVLPGVDTANDFFSKVAHGLFHRYGSLFAFRSREHIRTMQFPFSHRADNILTIDKPAQKDALSCKCGDGATEGVLDGLDNILPTDQDEVRVILLHKFLECVLMGFLHKDVNIAMSVELIKLRNACIDPFLLYLAID